MFVLIATALKMLIVRLRAPFQDLEMPASARLWEGIECLVSVVCPERRNCTIETDINVRINCRDPWHFLTDTLKLLP